MAGCLQSTLNNMSFLSDSARMVAESSEKSSESAVHKWLVLDGCLHSHWVDGMSTLLSDSGLLSTADRQRIFLPGVCHII